MSGADLANLVNEAALFAVRHGSSEIACARLRVRRATGCSWAPGASRMVLSDEEKELTAYHEAGHAVLRRRARPRRPAAQGHDPPDGHGPGRHPAAARRGAPRYARTTSRTRCAWPWAAGSPRSSCSACVSTGANNDLVVATELGPQDGPRVGHERPRRARWRGARRARSSSARTSCTRRDYSDDTARVIDEEVEKILRDRRTAAGTSPSTAAGSTCCGSALLDRETLDGSEVAASFRPVSSTPNTLRPRTGHQPPVCAETTSPRRVSPPKRVRVRARSLRDRGRVPA